MWNTPLKVPFTALTVVHNYTTITTPLNPLIGMSTATDTMKKDMAITMARTEALGFS
jgi:hypothetical protein